MEQQPIRRGVDEPMRRVAGVLACLIVLAGCGSRAAAVTESSPGLAHAATSGHGLPARAQNLSLDAAVGGCIGSSTDRMAVLSIASAMDFHAIFPSAALTPELEKVGQLEIVIYKDGWPGIVLGKPGVTPKPKPGTWDVCVRAADGSTIEGLPFVVYSDIPVDGSPVRP